MEILYKLRESLLNIGVAGVNLIEQDFRLKNNIEQLASVCENSPVLKKVYSLCLKLLQEENKITTYLDLLALIDAVLTTQGKNIKIQNLEEFKTYDLPIENNLYSQVSSVINALTSKFSGRVSELQNIVDINPKVFLDYRVVKHTINSLKDSYYEIPILLKDCLIKFGNEKIVPLLKEDLKGKSGAYKLEIIGSICKEKENDFYLDILKSAKGDLFKETIKCLSYDKNNRGILLDLYNKNNKKYIDILPYLLFSLAKISNKDDFEIKEVLIENLTSISSQGYLKEECINCSCRKCNSNKVCKSKNCNMDCSLNNVIEDKNIIDFLNENIPYSEESLLSDVYAQILEIELEKDKKILNLVDFIKKPIKDKKFYMDIFKRFCCRYSDSLEKLYFKYLNNENKCIQLLLSEILVYNILVTQDKRFIDLAIKIHNEDKDELFISSYFLASLLTKPAKEVFEQFSEKVFPEKNENMFDLDRIVFETKTINLQMLLFGIELINEKNIIAVSDKYFNIEGDRFNKYELDTKMKNLKLELHENLYADWFNLVIDENKLIFDFTVQGKNILFYKPYHILQNTNILCKSNILGFIIKNNNFPKNEQVGKYIYMYVLGNRIPFSLELLLKCLKIINNCGIENSKYLINKYLNKNLDKIVNNYYYDFSKFVEYFETFDNVNNNSISINDNNFIPIKEDLIKQLYEQLNNHIKNKDYKVQSLLSRIKKEFDYLLNENN